MRTETLLSWAMGFATVWFVVVVVHAFWMARDARRDPLPPDPIEHHGHGQHDVHAHGAGHQH